MRVLVALGFLLYAACGHDGAPASVESTDEAVSGADGLTAPKASCAPAKSFTAAAWPEADALFHRDPRWLGADAAYSVELGPGRILWLFGDTFVATTDRHVRSEAAFVRNSVAIQTGTDPTTSTIAFRWRETGRPTSFFAEEGAHWFWPLHGARVGGELVLFLNELARSTGVLGFQSVGTRMVRVSNPDADPADWTFTMRALPSDGRSHGTGVVLHRGHLYALTTKQTFFFDVELERWSEGELGAPGAFWNGRGFGPDSQSTPIWKVGAAEFVTAAHCGEWVTVESRGFGATDLGVRRAKSLAGPWSEPVKIFRPEESDRPNPFVYAGKFHPALTGGDLVATYAANSTNLSDVIRDATLYWPRFVRITEHR